MAPGSSRGPSSCVPEDGSATFTRLRQAGLDRRPAGRPGRCARFRCRGAGRGNGRFGSLAHLTCDGLRDALSVIEGNSHVSQRFLVGIGGIVANLPG